MTPDEVRDLIAEAVAAERERCARIADRVAERGYADQGYEIAALIREGRP